MPDSSVPASSAPDSGGLGSRFPSSSQSAGLALWHVTNRWQSVMRAALARHDLTHVQYVLLATLVWHHAHDPDSTVTQTDLAALASTDPMMTSQVLRALETKRLIERMPHSRDGRARILRATAAGVSRARNATADVEAADERFFAALDDVARFGRELGLLTEAATSPRSPDRP